MAGPSGPFELSRWGVALAMLLGHVAAALSFAAGLSLIAAAGNVGPLPRSPDEWLAAAQAAAWVPVITALLGLFVAAAMLPASLLTAPVTWFLATELRTGARATMAIGAAVGVLDVCAMLAWQGTFTPGPRQAPDPLVTLVTFCSCAAAAGAVYAAVVWGLCIRPRLGPSGAARWRESV